MHIHQLSQVITLMGQASSAKKVLQNVIYCQQTYNKTVTTKFLFLNEKMSVNFSKPKASNLEAAVTKQKILKAI